LAERRQYARWYPEVVAARWTDAVETRAVRLDECSGVCEDDPLPFVLLTNGRRHPMQVETVGLAGCQEYWDGFFAGDGVFYGHVLGFKGLERTVVVLAVNGVRDPARGADDALHRAIAGAGAARGRGPRGYVEEVGGEAVRKRLRDVWQWRLV